jgi:hypothetical protein
MMKNNSVEDNLVEDGFVEDGFVEDGFVEERRFSAASSVPRTRGASAPAFYGCNHP